MTCLDTVSRAESTDLFNGTCGMCRLPVADWEAQLEDFIAEERRQAKAAEGGKEEEEEDMGMGFGVEIKQLQRRIWTKKLFSESLQPPMNQNKKKCLTIPNNSRQFLINS